MGQPLPCGTFLAGPALPGAKSRGRGQGQSAPRESVCLGGGERLGSAWLCPHSLRYFYTAVSEAGPGLPQFTVVGYLDDQLFFHFDSEGKVAQPRAPWIQAEGPEYWARQTWIAKGWQEAFNGNVRIAMERYNQSRGLHTFQYTYGCQLRADGSAGGFRQYGYDGRDFLSYDTRTHTWVAPSKEAEITKGKMEADRHLSQQQRDYLERKCVEWLQKYLGYGKETLQRRERPAVRVTGRDAPGGPTTLWCRAHGFYPQDITLIWLQNGGRRKQEKWRGGVLPNGDGTYYAWATVKIDPQERGLYHCHVEHESLAEPFVAVWGEPGGMSGHWMKWWGCHRATGPTAPPVTHFTHLSSQLRSLNQGELQKTGQTNPNAVVISILIFTNQHKNCFCSTSLLLRSLNNAVPLKCPASGLRPDTPQI
uniref:Ig-like domain-containing protein n=1 Tax=Chelonoidis abingdonii TaxID=106734 RepID=A0A8C0INL6_CHEAB